jgi:16S rRNA (cytosine967-C5)-methyltransferase
VGRPILAAAGFLAGSRLVENAPIVSPARQIAFHILHRVSEGGYASDLLLRHSAELPARDAALAETIVFGCLRLQAQLDFLTNHFAGRPQPKLDPEVRIALRMGIYQLRYLERIPAHAAVTESVELVKRARKVSAAGFVNAVLRKVNREPVTWPDRATELSIPGWMLERWTLQYGAEAAEKIAGAALEQPDSPINPATGRRQDLGSQSIVPLLDIESGMTVLDVCAAPGNKTAQMIAAGGRVFASDRSLARLKEVPEAANRVVVDASAPLPFDTKFDRILVDAPCSGTGTLGRNPEIKWRIKASDIARFPALQSNILRAALAILKPGGRLVYSTCSMEREENEDVVSGFAVKETHLRLPGRDLGDGFFAAVIT